MLAPIAAAISPRAAMEARAPLLLSRTQSWVSFGLPLMPWLLPLGGIAGWMVYPALTTEFKQTLGLHNVGIVPAPAEEN